MSSMYAIYESEEISFCQVIRLEVALSDARAIQIDECPPSPQNHLSRGLKTNP